MASILKSSSKGVDAKVEFVPSVIVGIDIGTARSGMSYAFTKRREEIVCSQKSDNPHLKELTAVLLRASDLGLIAFGEEAQKEYLEIDPVKQAADFLYFEKFKMVLYGDNLSERPLVTAANGKKVPSVEVFAAALSYFKTKAMKELKEATSGLLTDADVQWVVTVPAIWSPGAKQLMREASKKAGLYDKIEAQVVLALESEAASLCCRERELQVNASQWKPGLRYMVVDLGGGTADVTVHKVTDQLNLGEVVASSGGPWGSVYIDNEFIQLLAKVFGEKVVHSFWSSYPLEAIDLMSSFEHVKMSATPKDNKPRRLKLPILFIQHVQQQTGKNIESLCADFALVYKPNAPAVSVKSPTAASATGDSSKSKSEKDTKSGGSSGAPAINFLDLQPSNVAANAEAAKPSSGTGGFASSLLSHIMPGYLGSKPAPAGSPTPPTPTAAATPSTATAAAAVGASTPSAKSGDSKSATAAPKKLDEWVFVGTEVPSAPGGIPASDACISWARGQLKLSAELVKSLFDPVVSKVVEHVEKVLSDVGVVSHIFMAGGFSESDFIKLAIESVIGPRGIRVITPPHAALAVLSGAVIYGLKPKVVSSRIVKRTYGVAVSTEWQQKKHSDRRKAFRSNNGKLVAFADNIFSPFCLSGDELKVDFSVTQTYTPGEDGQKVMVLRVYQSKSRAVTYIDAPDAHHVATLECPMLDLTGGMTRSVEVTMKFGATEIMVTAVDQTSGADVTCKLSFLDGSLGLDGNSKVTASA